jgi:hypothetical protein
MMRRIRPLIAVAAIVQVAAVLAACSPVHREEHLADAVTRAVIADDMSGVARYFDAAARTTITRIRVAELSDELTAQGAYEGLREDRSWCKPGFLCFDVRFAKRPYREIMKLDSDGKIAYWYIHAAR